MAGRELDVTVNALFELVIPATCTDESPEFVTETLVDAVVPIFTFPKSTEDGVMTSDAEFEDGEEKALESDPHPDNPTLRTIPITARAAQKRRPLN